MYDDHAENAPRQELLDVITDICNVVKGQNAFMPSDDLERAAIVILEAGEASRVLGFKQWWDNGGSYYEKAGRPTLKSFTDEWPNYIDGVDMTETATPQLTEMQRIAQRIEAKHGMDN